MTPQLQQLQIGSCFRLDLPRLLQLQFNQLRSLHLSSLAAVDDQFVKDLLDRWQLKQLNLSKCSHVCDFLVCIWKLLSIVDMQVTDWTVSLIERCLSLESVNLTFCSNVSRHMLQCVPTVIGACSDES